MDCAKWLVNHYLENKYTTWEFLGYIYTIKQYNMLDHQLFEDFSDAVTTTVIKKNWTVTYKGQEITGAYSYESDSWGFYDRTVEINEEHLENLSAEEIDEIHDYVEDVIN